MIGRRVRWSRPRPGAFTRARLRLTGWYAALLILVLATVGAIAYVLMTDRLDAQVDGALKDAVLAAAPRLGQLVAGSGSPLPVVEAGGSRAQPGAGEAAEPEQDEEDHGPLHELAERGQIPTHQLLLNLDGTLLESTLSIATQPLAPPVAAARTTTRDLRTIHVDHQPVRVLTQRVSLAGEPIGFVQAFRSLEDRDATASDLLRIFLTAGGIVGAGALVAGYWLAGRALQPIQRNMEAQERFIADASHELRTPIAVVQSSADVLLRHPDHRIGDEREIVEGIAEEAARMGALVRELLDVGTIEQAPLDKELVTLSDVAVEAVQGFAALTGDRLSLDAPADVQVLGDRAALLQVVRILIENAIRHTPGDSHIQVLLRKSGSHAELRVTDDGPGIPAGEHQRIFERFARVDKARARELGGSGLGLAIARAIVSRHRGTISVASVPPDGAAFTVRIPLG